jgi:hypothetical protein
MRNTFRKCAALGAASVALLPLLTAISFAQAEDGFINASYNPLAGRVLGQELGVENRWGGPLNEGLFRPDADAEMRQRKSMVHFQDAEGRPIDDRSFADLIWHGALP